MFSSYILAIALNINTHDTLTRASMNDRNDKRQRDARLASLMPFFILEQRNIYTWLYVPLTGRITI